MRTRIRRRTAGAAAVGAACVLLVAGCAITPGDGRAEAATGGTDGTGGTGGKTANAPVTPLSLRSAAYAATWTGSDERAHQLKITPTSLARGAESDLARVRLDDDLKGMVPYYLTFSYTNTGKHTLTMASPESNFSVNGVDGLPGQSVSLMSTAPATSSGRPAACRNSGAGELAAGDTTKVCQIFMLPKKAQPATVSYQDGETNPLIWQVDGADAAAAGLLPAEKTVGSVWQDTDDRSVPLRITPKSVRAGSAADLSRYDLDADEKKLVPYYVTLAYRNTGAHDLYPGMQDGVELRSASGRGAKKMTLIDIGGDGVGQCPDAVPNEMVRPGGTVTQCSIHLLPKTDHPVAVAFTGKGSGARTVTWLATEGTK